MYVAALLSECMGELFFRTHLMPFCVLLGKKGRKTRNPQKVATIFMGKLLNKRTNQNEENCLSYPSLSSSSFCFCSSFAKVFQQASDVFGKAN